ncbi:MAG: NADH-quinone oxidoreductase subunit L [Candidatus Latescibacteria bacterium]|nr:NADH-quinone oxidoreductase subunit L [Candidatus Latescibacterota bacterium]NIM66389.1 NADH-quinone oxidoreductase subunit L [Candidatus Latescibacterota bacterium]NIO02868.1 NADH-quinone oxidoreductase subunit L [Candidatus Latescibacterota bacterium]NIO30003.1 NADH-quinone oxidoreductase subunit L [Candidatus Latescibacterota bacterium]NIO57618.1 NADH-quinone oxidoreductase subunit L [Candidatus Latescibacterota bacterium]
MWFEEHIYLIVLIPFIGSFINGLNSFLGNRMPKRWVGWIACGAVFIPLLISIRGLFYLRSLPPADRAIESIVYTWIEVGNVHLDAGFLFDQLSCVMALVVTGVGFLIHVYSIGYMGHDSGYSRYFSYMNLFTFSMLLLVLGNNLLLMFVGWEGVGLCSYLLIGFWFDHKPNAVAGMKAFIVNRIGDFGFLIGILLLFVSLGLKGHWTLTFSELSEHSYLLGRGGVVTAIALCLFVGATGKSAQIPLYTWLPDAMAGPTPVSALIHAATMVTAGVYMIARMNFIYTASPAALAVVATVGAVTALYAGSIGLAQNDIKRVLAYSTVSQLGYMFLGVGVAAYAAGIFHLMTHAFFKGLLFLGAGSVIHAMSNRQDMREMGGLRSPLRVTYITFMTATLAIVGIFPFAGFFSKDEILWKTWASGHYGLWVIGFIGAGVTAFYMFRLVALTFFGKNRADAETQHHIHESPKVMLWPLVILAVLSFVGGWIGIPKGLGGNDAFHHWLEPVFSHASHEPGGEDLHATFSASGESFVATLPDADASHDTAADGLIAPVEEARAAIGSSELETQHGGAHNGDAEDHGLERFFAVISVLWVILCGFLGFRFYTKRIDIVNRLKGIAGGLIHRVIENKYYVDEIYQAAFVDNLLRTVKGCGIFDNLVIDGLVNGTAFFTKIFSFVTGLFDNSFIDGLVNAVANIVTATGQRLRVIQSGQIQGYLYFVFSITVLIICLKWLL